MNIYVVEEIWPYDGSEIHAVFAKECDALKSVEERIGHKVKEWTIQENAKYTDVHGTIWSVAEYRVQ